MEPNLTPRDGLPEGLQTPLDPALRRRLRRAVLDHAGRERRRHHPAVLHAGEPGGFEVTFPLDPDEPTDPGLRADVVSALVRRTAAPGRVGPAPLLWLTRSGDLGALQDVDARWLAAARAAGAEAGLRLEFVVVGRHGWRDPRSGLTRGWNRARERC
jgi:hypothetical protein